MQLRRAVPLSLLALLASAGCVSVSPQDSAPVRAGGSVPPANAPDAPPAVPAPPLALPLGELPAAAADDPGADPSQAPPAARAGRPPVPRPAKPAAPPRRPRAAKPVLPHPVRRPAPPLGMDAVCAAAEGTVPPSLVDLCLRQYGR
ncbi:hypothetical protein [Streptomyces subrutilus]|uniref:Lipoprotein n=1 Tax=Streptomyces subrutilus TaxID=36818 RepID=A0A1E5PMB4_9ACTN|nr:hypothetical protein [Streptomyces subrutilus]OEJ30698.1 hypothetical protein BGK67_04485 [Streptomyces subrutilus]